MDGDGFRRPIYTPINDIYISNLFSWLIIFTFGPMNKIQVSETVSYLISRIGKAHRNRANELLSSLLLQQIYQQQGITLNELTCGMCVSAVTVTRTVERLEKNGFLKKERCTFDQRAVRVYLTEKGVTAVETVEEKMWEVLEGETVDNLSTEERMLLKRLLMQVLSNLS
jgi:DNA-binding MarR family transcriptional regulator